MKYLVKICRDESMRDALPCGCLMDAMRRRVSA